MVLVYPYLHHTLHLPFQPQGSGYSLACFHVINPFLPRDCKAVHTPIEPCWDPCRGTLVAFKQIPSYQVKGQTHSAASFFFGLPDFVSARLRKFRRIMSFSFHIKMPSCVSPSPQKCHLQGRVSQRSHVSQVRARNLTSQTQLSPLNSSWALRGWLSIKMAGTSPHVPFKTSRPPGPSTAPMGGAQHRLLSGFPPVIVSQAPMKWRVYWEGLAPGIRLASRCRRLPSSHNRDDIHIVLLHIVMGDGVVE